MQKFPQGLGLLNYLLDDIYSSKCISYATSSEEPFLIRYNNNWERLLKVYALLGTLLKVSETYVANGKSIAVLQSECQHSNPGSRAFLLMNLEIYILCV